MKRADHLHYWFTTAVGFRYGSVRVSLGFVIHVADTTLLQADIETTSFTMFSLGIFYIRLCLIQNIDICTCHSPLTVNYILPITYAGTSDL